MRTFTRTSLIAIITAAVLAVTAQTADKQTADNRTKSKLFDADRLLTDVRTLSADDMEGRSADRQGMRKARDYVDKRFVESGLQSFGGSFRQEFEIKQRGAAQSLTGVNFVGWLKGKKDPDKFIVITAHYDHDGVKDGMVYNGADDNASGTAALFAIASYFKKSQPDHSLIFVAFDAEEKGLLGSRYFVANLPVKKESVLLNVNMDMVSRNDKGELYAAGAFHYPQLRLALVAAQKKAKVKLLLGHDDPKLGRDDWTNQSDHATFHADKIPFIYFGVEDHPDYHKPTDDFANIQPEFYVKAAEAIVEAIKQIDKTSNHLR